MPDFNWSDEPFTHFIHNKSAKAWKIFHDDVMANILMLNSFCKNKMYEDIGENKGTISYEVKPKDFESNASGPYVVKKLTLGKNLNSVEKKLFDLSTSYLVLIEFMEHGDFNYSSISKLWKEDNGVWYLSLKPELEDGKLKEYDNYLEQVKLGCTAWNYFFYLWEHEDVPKRVQKTGQWEITDFTDSCLKKLNEAKTVFHDLRKKLYEKSQ